METHDPVWSGVGCRSGQVSSTLNVDSITDVKLTVKNDCHLNNTVTSCTINCCKLLTNANSWLTFSV